MNVYGLKVCCSDIRYLDIYWTIDPASVDVLSTELYLQRSDAQFGPFFDITGAMIDTSYVRDTTLPNTTSVFKDYYYRLKLVNKSDSSVKYFPEEGRGGVKLAAAPDLAGLEIARLRRLAIQEGGGRKLWIFPKKSAGQRCVCYDKVTGRSIRSQCATCFNTTWVGGYDTPVMAWGIITSGPETVATMQQATMEVVGGTLVLGNYPELHQGDLVIEAENVRWKVGDSIQKTRKSRFVIWQSTQLVPVGTRDVEYGVPFNIGDLSSLSANPERNTKNQHTLDP